MSKKLPQAVERQQLEIDDFVRLVGAFNSMRNGNGHTVPITDPSLNVSKEMSLRASFDKELRDTNADWQKRFDSERQRANDAKADKESARVDSRFTELSTQALALVQTVATTAKAAQEAVTAAALQQTEAMNQLREIVSRLATTVTELVAAGGARVAATQENVQAIRFDQNRVVAWTGVVISVAILAVSTVYTIKLLSGK